MNGNIKIYFNNLIYSINLIICISKKKKFIKFYKNKNIFININIIILLIIK